MLLLLSLSSSSSSSSTTTCPGVIAAPSPWADNVKVHVADVPADLPAIRGCRCSAYAGRSINLPAARLFCNVDQITRTEYVCVVAIKEGGGGGKDDGRRVLGTANLNTNTGVVNNVYVREGARGHKLI